MFLFIIFALIQYIDLLNLNHYNFACDQKFVYKFDGVATAQGINYPLGFFFALQRIYKRGFFMDKLLIAILLMCVFAPLLH
jgi:hypothetical protein